MLKVQNLSKNYGTKQALCDINFEISKPGIYALMGLNGAGKSTLFKTLCAILSQSSGTIEINGKKSAAARKKLIGYLPEENAVYHDMTVGEYLRFFAGLLGVKKQKVQDFISLMSEQIGLPPEKNMIGELSYGQKRKVLFSRAVLSDPPFLILDEPVAQVDVVTERAINGYIKQLAKSGKTIFYSTHFFPLAQKLSDDLLVIHEGKLLLHEKTQTVLKQHPKGLEEAFLSLINHTTALNA